MNIDRKTASRLLGVSIRTIDRYIRSGKIFANVDSGRIWLNKREIMLLRQPQKQNVSINATTRQADSPVQSQIRDKVDNTNFYQDLYNEAKRALNDYQQKLEQSNYRIGQLESQIIHPAAPKLIERSREDNFSLELLKKELSDKERELSSLREMVKNERAGRTALLILVYLLLAALPLIWYLLR